MKIAMILRLIDAGMRIATMLMGYRVQLGETAKGHLERMRRLYRRENLRQSRQLGEDIEAELARRMEENKDA